MATNYYTFNTSQNSSQRPVAMALALVSAVVLSPLYNVGRRNEATRSYYETKWSSGFVLPMVLGGLIIAIRTVSSSTSGSVSTQRWSSTCSGSGTPSAEASSWVLRIGSSSWGLAGVLVMLMFVLSWQESAQQFFWR